MGMLLWCSGALVLAGHGALVLLNLERRCWLGGKGEFSFLQGRTHDVLSESHEIDQGSSLSKIY